MYPALWIAKTGLDAEQTRMAVISNNLANVNTTGFKQSRAEFAEVFAVGVQSVSSNASGSGVRTSRIASRTRARDSGTASASPPSSRISFTVSASFSMSRATTATRAPARPIMTAVA